MTMAGRAIKGGPEDASIDAPVPDNIKGNAVADESADLITAKRYNDDGKPIEILEVPMTPLASIVALENLGFQFSDTDRKKAVAADKKAQDEPLI